jgi:hypothetical protein
VAPASTELSTEDATLVSLAKLLVAAQQLRCVVFKEMRELVSLVIGLTEWQTAVDAALRLPCRTPLPFDMDIVLALQKELGEIAVAEATGKDVEQLGAPVGTALRPSAPPPPPRPAPQSPLHGLP